MSLSRSDQFSFLLGFVVVVSLWFALGPSRRPVRSRTRRRRAPPPAIAFTAPTVGATNQATAAIHQPDEDDRDRAMVAALAHDTVHPGDALARRVRLPASRKQHATRPKAWITEAPTAAPSPPPTPAIALLWTGSKHLALPPAADNTNPAAAHAHLTGPSAAFAALLAEPRWAARAYDFSRWLQDDARQDFAEHFSRIGG